MIEQVKRKIVRAQMSNANTLYCDFLNGAREGSQVDHILVSQVLLHVKDTSYFKGTGF